MTERMTGGVLQPNGDKMVGAAHGRAERRRRHRLHGDALRSDANALFLNIMATKMPFVGRG